MKSVSRTLLPALIASLASGAVHGQETVGPPARPDAQAASGTPGTSVEEPAPPAWTAEERTAIELLRSLRQKERPPDAELAARLGPAGERLLPLLFEVLAARAVPGLDGEAPQVLSEIQENVVLLALARLDREPVLAHVGVRLAAGPDPRLRHAALGGVGAVARANDLPQLFDLCFPPEELELDERLARALRRAVTTLLAHDPRGFEQLVTLRRITRPELLPVLVEAVGASRDPHGLLYLSEIAYWHEGLVLLVMSQVPLLGTAADEAVNDALRVRLRPYLDEGKPGHCRAAVTALEALADLDSIGPLIALLDSESAGLRQNAHWALRSLTGLELSANQETWARWHQAELAWLVRSKPREFQRLRDGDAATVSDALRTILEHPLARAEFASALPELLKNRFPAIRALACQTLADLDATDAVEKLVWALEDPTPEVSQAAHAALRSLTRLDLPRDPLAWQSATNSEPRGAEL